MITSSNLKNIRDHGGLFYSSMGGLLFHGFLTRGLLSVLQLQEIFQAITLAKYILPQIFKSKNCNVTYQYLYLKHDHHTAHCIENWLTGHISDPRHFRPKTPSVGQFSTGPKCLDTSAPVQKCPLNTSALESRQCPNGVETLEV